MRENYNIQVQNIPLDEVLSGYEGLTLGAGQWINFLDVPSGADISLSFDGNARGALIPVVQGLQVKGVHGKVYLWSNTALAGQSMKIAHGSGDFAFINPPISSFDELGELGATALAQMDKIINPYVVTPTYTVSTTSSTMATMLSKTLTCDKIEISFNAGRVSTNYADIQILVDGQQVAGQFRDNNLTYGGEYSSRTDHIVLDGVIGKTLLIKGYNSGGHVVLATITEKTLKP